MLILPVTAAVLWDKLQRNLGVRVSEAITKITVVVVMVATETRRITPLTVVALPSVRQNSSQSHLELYDIRGTLLESFDYLGVYIRGPLVS